MKRILVIEDDLSIHQNIIDILENENYKVISAYNGKSGIEIAKKTLPDLIICDVMMPGVTGYQVLSEISSDNLTQHIPFIFLSAKVEKADIKQGLDLGADDYLTKPFKIDDLLNVIEKYLNRKSIL